MGRNLTLLLVLVSVLVSSCSDSKKTTLLENASIVGKLEKTAYGDMISLDPTLLKDSVVFPISHFMGDIEIVKLDNRDEALISETAVIISENYILTGNSSRTKTPCKLFDIKGKYIGDVGAIGQGPGEYNNIYSMQIDEKSKRIYLLPWQSDNLLVYDLLGNVLEPIKLPYRANKGVFKVEGNKLTVAVIPFPNIPTVAWVQTLDGEILHEIPAGHLTTAFDFSNEIESKQNTADMDLSFWFWPTRIDTLYHIDTEKGVLVPKFTVNFDENNMEPHSYAEWPDYYMGNTKIIYTTSYSNNAGDTFSENVGSKNEYYIVDKKTLKGALLRIENDYWGGNEEWPIYLFNKGYYSLNMDPGNFEEWIDKKLKSDSLKDDLRLKLTEIRKSISADDNNYILYAKMKK